MDHFRRAKRDQHENHPFYSALRKYGTSSAKWEVFYSCEDLEEAKAAEINAIAVFQSRDRRFGYNLSEGGDYDCLIGPKIFWDRFRSDPEYREEYLKKLVAGVQRRKDRDGFPYPVEAIEANRKRLEAMSARERWKLQWRRVRLAKKTVEASKGGKSSKNEWKKTSDTNAGRPTQKALKSIRSRIAAKKQWAARTSEEVSEVSKKISKAAVEHHKNLSSGDRSALLDRLSDLRSKIDRSVQGPAASRGIKQFWVDLKADPERYAAHIAKRRETLLKTLREKGHEVKDDLRHRELGA